MSTLTRPGRAFLAASIALAACLAFGGGDPPAAGPKADPEVQARIEQAVAAIVRNEADLGARVEAVRASGAGDRQRLLLQLALYLEASASTERSMGGALLLNELAFTPEEKVGAVLPHLDTAGPGLRRVLAELLGTIDRPEGGEPDFTFYEARIRDEKDAPPAALIRYMCEVSPDAALASLERIYGPAPARKAAAGSPDDLRRLFAAREAGASWSAPERARVRDALSALSQDPGWWRRLYTAAVVGRYPDLADPELTERLKGDPSPLVRGALAP